MFSELDDRNRVRQFAELMEGKWVEGRIKYRNTSEEPFVGDPTEQLMSECIDIANYALETYYQAESLRNRLRIIGKGLGKGGI